MCGLEDDILRVLDEYSRKIKRELEHFIPRRVDEKTLSEIIGEPSYRYEPESINKSILQPFWDLIDRGGKRWRPALTLMVYEAIGGKIEEILPLAIIPETIHNGTLVVDDVEDDSEFRRGKPCIHRIYGVDIALNMGNTMYFLPMLILSKIDISEHKKARILEEYIKTMVELSLGQAMDIAWHRGLVDEVDEEQYLQMTLFKTGALARFSIRIATIMAHTPREIEDKLSRFGESIAIAFQIQDDILNIIGDELKYGKEIGGDIREGKRTLVVVRALKTLEKEKAKRLKEIINLRTSDIKLINEAISLIKESGFIEYAKSLSKQLVSKAWEQIDKIIEDSTAKKNLKALADFLIMREY